MNFTVSVRENVIKSDKLKWLSVVALGPRSTELGSCLVTGWDTDVPCLCYFSVARNYRSRGVGTRMILICVEMAHKAKKTAISLIVNRRNVRAARLYHRLGFRIAISDDKQWWMSFPLNDPRFLRRLKSR